ncbi:triacylglycerol lipase 1-like isoform X2 [Olea europaea var. sylvestris]|uniref:Lipase n=1 Tax=Olea europaea subsp. europaea TaxID=158383 RepID=A0A8S0TF65_OLEEU|nr:triacylglycerol lipase 1-like isoform X2 [Olea europaea var. sylvestris]CAA3003726.1 triacylglycerol lipase 1 [Olea europaea subsp. europaea]
MELSAALKVALLSSLLLSAVKSAEDFNDTLNLRQKSHVAGLCAQLIEPAGFPCSEHNAQTKDGFVLGLQRVSSSSGILRRQMGPPVLLIHGLFMAGDAWFLDTPNQSLGFILANRGFDVWVGNVRGTRWCHGHISLSEKDKKFWDWSWQEYALYDLQEMIRYVYTVTNSRVFVIGYSQGTIISLAAFTEPDTVQMVGAAALLCPITYLNHMTARLPLRLVKMHLTQVLLAVGIHELNFKSDWGTRIMEMMCDRHVDCGDLLSSITVIRKGTFAKYDYGFWKNLKHYGQLKPPKFDLSQIPSSLPLWMGYGGNDALADVTDLQHTLKELQSKPDLLYLENYGHLDFLLSTRAKEDVYDKMLAFFDSLGTHSSY